MTLDAENGKPRPDPGLDAGGVRAHGGPAGAAGLPEASARAPIADHSPTAPAPAATPRPVARAFRQGMIAALPFMVVTVPFGMLFGVVATKAGMDLVETMVMTSFVIAGASQFALVELLSQQVPVIIAVIAALAVNLRMAMYSASLAPYLRGASPLARVLIGYTLVDQTYGVGIRRFQSREEPVSVRLAYFFGVAAPVFPCWIASGFVGAVAGGAIPASLSIDFAPPVTFIAIFAPMLRGAANWAAAVTAVALALALDGLPWSLGLIIAAAVGMSVGALVEIRLARRREASA